MHDAVAGLLVRLERRLSEAITATAAIIIGAWEQAGRPAIKLNGPRPVQKVRKPQ